MIRRLLSGPADGLRVYLADTVEGHNYRNLIISGGWVGIIEAGINTYLPVFLARLGASPTVMGLLTSGPFLVGIVAYFPGGAYAERHSNQVKVANISSIFTRSGYLWIALLPLALAPKDIPLAVIIIWALIAIPAAVFTPSFFTVVQQAVPLPHRARFLGVRWAMMTTVAAIAIPTFGLLLDRTGLLVGYPIVFFASFIAGLVHVIYFVKIQVPAFVQERTAGIKRRGLTGQLRAYLSPFVESRLFLRYSLATVGYRLALYMPLSLFSIYWVNNLKATDTLIGVRGGVAYAVLAVGYILWGGWTNRWGERVVLLICGAGLGLYTLLTAAAPTMEWLPLVAVVWGLAGSGIDIGLFGLMMAVSPEGKRPSFVAATYVLSSITSFAGPLLGAMLAEALDVRTALFISGAAQVATVLFFLWLPRTGEIAAANNPQGTG
jgi:MFS family permease